MGLSHCRHHHSQPNSRFWSLYVFNQAFPAKWKEEVIAFFLPFLEIYSEFLLQVSFLRRKDFELPSMSHLLLRFPGILDYLVSFPLFYILIPGSVTRSADWIYIEKRKKINKKLFQGVWRQGLAGYNTASISQLFPGEHLGSFFAGMEDWSKKEVYS